ncbi:MAG: elongation factor Ts [Thermoleophilia bacterium]|nr:elongation factor Ts [Thermoleophilia bacterium]
MTAQITASQVKQLRDATQAGMMDAKKALVETNGDFDAAVTLLREKGIAKAGKLGARDTTEGRVAIAGTANGAALVQVGCNTDFVAKNDDFGAFVTKLAHHVLDHKPENVEELLTQAWADGTVEDARAETSSSTGENIVIQQVAHFDHDAGTEGVIGRYLHGTGIGVLVDVEGPSNDEIETFANDVAMHIAASSPQYLVREEVPADVIEAERSIFLKQVEDKPEAIRGKIADGKIDKWFSDVALVEQPWIFAKDRLGKDVTIEGYAKLVSEKVGAPVRVRRFVRFAVKG